MPVSQRKPAWRWRQPAPAKKDLHPAAADPAKNDCARFIPGDRKAQVVACAWSMPEDRQAQADAVLAPIILWFAPSEERPVPGPQQ